MTGPDRRPEDRASKAGAQQRVDQIAAFEREVGELERAGILTLGEDQRAAIGRHHAQLLATLATRFDVDRTEPQRQMALGMRVAALLAAATLSAAVVLFFYRVWGLLVLPAQLAILAAMPLLLVAAVEVAARREPTRYLASVVAIIASVAFALDLAGACAVFNTTPAPVVLLAWSAFALTLAYAYGLRLLLAAGIGAAMGYGVAAVAAAAGVDWTVAVARPEPLLVLGPGAIALASFPPVVRTEGFDTTWRLMGTGALLLPLLFLSTWPEVFSYRLLPPGGLHAIYDVAGFVLPAVVAWWGVSRRWTRLVDAGAGFLVLFAYAKFFDWWWAALPRYLFFLVLGLLSIGTLLVLSRLRRRMREV
jgi:hypothetical protein